MQRRPAKRKKTEKKSPFSGYTLITLLIFFGILVILLTASASYVISQAKATNFKNRQQKILEIAEAGANYYRWHLAHVPDDFTDGTGGPGPYLHDYRDINGNVIGKFSLNIVAPESGSTIITIESTGYLLDQPDLTTTVVLKMGIPSFSTYAVVANDKMRFGEGTEVWGPIHSNDGIRFDGLAHNIVSSAKDKYDDPDHGGSQEFGVHTHVPPQDPLPPQSVPARPDVFAAGRTFPVPPLDFNGITADLAIVKTKAIEGGIYLTSSGTQGYHVHFNVNHTVDIKKVTSQAYCRYRWYSWWYDYSDIWSIATETQFTYKGASSLGIAVPSNGLIFIEDDVWVDGQIDNDKMTLVAAREPLASANANIIINNDLKYTNHDESNVIGLIAQTNVAVGFYSEDDLEIDAALIAQKGAVTRFYYPNRSAYQQNPAHCADNVYRDILTLYGAIATNQRYGFAYTDGTGYNLRHLNFDPNLTYGPPPSFPTSGEYTIISWEEK